MFGDVRPARSADRHLGFGLCCLIFCLVLMAADYAAPLVGPARAGAPEAMRLSEAVQAVVSGRAAAERVEAQWIDAEPMGAEPLDLQPAGAERLGAEPADAERAAADGNEAGRTEAGPAAGATSKGGQSAGDAAPPAPATPVVRASLADLLVLVPGHGADGADAGRATPRYPLQEEYAWLQRCQTASGALRMAPGDPRCNPYFGNYAAMALLRWEPDAARRYIIWYLGRLNQPDGAGLWGTIYDHHVQGQREVAEAEYDAADSYAATFLTLVARYLWATGDAQLVAAYLPQLDQIAGVCLALQDADGLTWAKADRRYKFLMDNCEVARGLEDWAETLRTLGFFGQAEPWAAAAGRVREAVERELWSEERGVYAWAKTPRGLRWPKHKWYPDTVAQVYPVLHGLIDAASPRAASLVAAVGRSFPGWPRLETGDQFPWAAVACAAALAGNRAQALEFADSAWETYLSSGRRWPWYNLEASYLCATLLELVEPGSSLAPRR